MKNQQGQTLPELTCPSPKEGFLFALFPRPVKPSPVCYLVQVTLYQFSTLSIHQPTEATWQGRLGFARKKKEQAVALYEVYGFWVVVYYHNETNETERFNLFGSKNRLAQHFTLQIINLLI